jgi:hypothetical protein
MMTDREDINAIRRSGRPASRHPKTPISRMRSGIIRTSGSGKLLAPPAVLRATRGSSSVTLRCRYFCVRRRMVFRDPRLCFDIHR